MKKFKISGVHDTPIIMMGNENHLQLYSEKDKKCYGTKFSTKEVCKDPRKWADRNVPVHPDDLGHFISAMKISQPEPKKSKAEDTDMEITPYFILDTLVNVTGMTTLSPDAILSVAKRSPDFARKYMRSIISQIYTFKWSTYVQGNDKSTVGFGSTRVDTEDVRILEFDVGTGIEEFDIVEFPRLVIVEFKTMEAFTLLERKREGLKSALFFERMYMPKLFEGWDFQTSYIKAAYMKLYSDNVMYFTKLNNNLRGLYLSGDKRVNLDIWFYQMDDEDDDLVTYKKSSLVKEERSFYITGDIEELSLPDAGLNSAFDMTMLKKLVKLNLGMTPRFLFKDYPPNVENLRIHNIPLRGSNVSSDNLKYLKKLTLFSTFELMNIMSNSSDIRGDVSVLSDENAQLPSLEEVETADGFSLPVFIIDIPSLKTVRLGRDFMGFCSAKVENFEAGEFFTAEDDHSEMERISPMGKPYVQDPDEVDPDYSSLYKFDEGKLKTLVLKNPEFKQYSKWFIDRFEKLEYLELGGEIFKGLAKPTVIALSPFD